MNKRTSAYCCDLSNIALNAHHFLEVSFLRTDTFGKFFAFRKLHCSPKAKNVTPDVAILLASRNFEKLCRFLLMCSRRYHYVSAVFYVRNSALIFEKNSLGISCCNRLAAAV